MALQKNKELSNGFSGDYWKVIETNINYLDECSHVALALWKDQAARKENKQPIESESFDWSGEDFPFAVPELEGKTPLQIAYENIKESKLDEDGKEMNFFADTKDI